MVSIAIGSGTASVAHSGRVEKTDDSRRVHTIWVFTRTAEASYFHSYEGFQNLSDGGWSGYPVGGRLAGGETHDGLGGRALPGLLLPRSRQEPRFTGRYGAGRRRDRRGQQGDPARSARVRTGP